MELMRITKDSSRLHAALGSNLYASRYSWISEICQNAVDSHRMAGVKEPITVGIRKGTSGRDVFYVRDIGLSFKDEEDFISKVGTIAESGKSRDKTSDDDCAMGEHGIGSMSPSAYSAGGGKWKYVVVTTQGKKFQCTFEEVVGKGIMYELQKLPKKAEDVKGVLFEIEVNHLGTNALISNILEKLAYFKDVFFEFAPHVIQTNSSLLVLNSTFQLFQSDDFQVSTLSKHQHMHVCLDQYSYPINWQILGILPIKLNIGLKFTMADGLKADLTRENLQYSEGYREIITEKIRKVAEWFVNKHNSTIPNEFTSVMKMQAARTATRSVTINNTPYPISELMGYSKVRVKDFKFKDVSEEVFNKFISRTDGGLYIMRKTHDITMGGNKISKNSYCSYTYDKRILIDKPVPTRTMDYIKHQFRGYGLYQKKELKLFCRGSYYNSDYGYGSIYGMSRAYCRTQFNGGKFSRVRAIIKESKILEDTVLRELCTIASEIVVPADFNKVPKKAPNRKAVGEIGVKYATKMDKSDYTYHCKFVEKVLDMGTLSRVPFFHIYGAEADRAKLDAIYRMYERSYYPSAVKVRACIITPTQQVHLKKLTLHNFMHIDEFMKGKHRVFRKMVTSLLIVREFMLPYKETLTNKKVIKDYISSEIAADIDKLEEYAKAFVYLYDRLDVHQITAMVELADELKLYDLSIYDKLQNMKKVIENLDYVNYLDDDLRCHNDKRKEKAIKALQDITRYRKVRMDWKNYKFLKDVDDNSK